MNLITEQNRVDVYRNAPEKIRELYTSDSLTNRVDTLYASFGVTEPFRSMSEIVGDTVLGFYKISDMPRLFQQKLGVSADESQRITSLLIESLSPVIAREEEQIKTKKGELTALADTFAKPNAERLENPDVQMHTDNVEPLRTMEGDMNRIHGYGAYNAAKEAETKTATDTEGDAK